VVFGGAESCKRAGGTMEPCKAFVEEGNFVRLGENEFAVWETFDMIAFAQVTLEGEWKE